MYTFPLGGGASNHKPRHVSINHRWFLYKYSDFKVFQICKWLIFTIFYEIKLPGNDTWRLCNLWIWLLGGCTISRLQYSDISDHRILLPGGCFSFMFGLTIAGYRYPDGDKSRGYYAGRLHNIRVLVPGGCKISGLRYLVIGQWQFCQILNLWDLGTGTLSSGSCCRGGISPSM